MKEFHIGDVLTITTGKLVSPRLMDGVYDILNYMTEDNLFTHQLPRVANECRPFLFKQYPELELVDSNCVNKENVDEWLQKQIKKFGEYLAVEKIPKEAHEYKSPILEAIEKLVIKQNKKMV